MSKAEDRANEIYNGDTPITRLRRKDYCDGYHQAEKDLIDKAIGWIGEIYNYCEIMRYSDSCEPTLSELTEWFKNYIKEDGKED